MIKFCRLVIVDFKLIGEADLNLRDRGLVLIVGVNDATDAATSNGSGKTTVFEAISWCLFGEVAIYGRLTDKAIRQGADSCEVTLHFEADDHKYRVTRRRNGTGGSLTLHVDDVPESGKKTADTQARVEEILGLDWDAFRNTVLFGQGDRSRFADRETTDAQRKAILKRVLRLERFDRALELVKDELKLRRRDYAVNESKLAAARAELARVDKWFDDVRLKSDRWTAQHVADEKKLMQALVREEALSPEDTAVLGDEIGLLKAQIGLYEELLEGASERAAEARAHEDALKVLKRAEDALRARAVSTDKQLRTATGKLQAAGEQVARGECPTCHQPLGTIDVSELIESLTAECNDLRVILTSVGDEAAVNGRAQADVKLRFAEADARCAEDRAHSKELRDVRADLASAQDELLEAQGHESRKNTLMRDLVALRATTNPHTEGEENFRVAQNEAASAVEVAVQDGEKIAVDLDVLEFWETAFGNRGIPAFAVETVLPAINAAAARYLETLSDGDLVVELTATTEKKDGGAKEAIDVLVTSEGAHDVPPSGGQWQKISLAVDLALMDLVAEREGARIDALFLDEVLDDLDAEGKSRVVALLHDLRERRSTIMVVAHDPAVAESFEHVVVVHKQDGRSVVMEG